jgi:uncharacterized protein with NRDE domain
LTVIAYHVIADYDILLLSNRDEHYERPTLPLHRWDSPEVRGWL